MKRTMNTAFKSTTFIFSKIHERFISERSEFNLRLFSSIAIKKRKRYYWTHDKVPSKMMSTVAMSQTPLGKESASHLLKGLDVYTIYSDDERKHPLSLYGINSKDITSGDNQNRRPILLLHGRTWSSVPVYHLLGGQGETTQGGHKSRSLMESLYNKGLQPYALDFRGFGGTPPDESNVVTPNTCVFDVGYALDFITKKHDSHQRGNQGTQESHGSQHHHLPVLLGWSQGALVAQLFAQKSPQLISKLVLYGSIYDPLVSYPPIPLYVNGTDSSTKNDRMENTFNAAIEDFTIEGSIPPEPATKFAQAALLSDPYKAHWSYLSQFNNLDPARVSVPTLVVAGDQDPYAPIRVQASLFENLGRGADRTWSIIADADHAVHLLDDGRDRFINLVTSFVENSKKGEKLF